MKAYVNEECILCGLCADACPEVFELGDERAEVKVDEVPEEHEECCHEAADSCPTDAIEIDDD
ncbi:MAG TPA: ferredoxin [Firmicutes bacterium]|nr:ferredoxin [Bacillota bacterium]